MTITACLRQGQATRGCEEERLPRHPGYNATATQRLANWPTGQQINGIVPGRGRIVFELEKGKTSAVGQADMKFFSFNDLCDLYCRQGGYTGKSVWDGNKGGISDEASGAQRITSTATWDEVKEQTHHVGRRRQPRAKRLLKLSIGSKRQGHLVFLSLYYGDDVWPINDKWHDRMIHARTIIDTFPQTTRT